MPDAISDTSPLLYLHRINALDWLTELFETIWIPNAVVLELQEGQQRSYNVPDPGIYTWLQIVELRSIPSELLTLDLGMDVTRKAQVIASEKNLLEAMKTSNVELLDKLLHDALLFNGPNGETSTKAMDLTNYRSGNINLHTVESSDQILNMIGDDVVVAVTVEIKGNYLGQEINGKFRYLRVWKQFENNWKVIAGSVVTLGTSS